MRNTPHVPEGCVDVHNALIGDVYQVAHLNVSQLFSACYKKIFPYHVSIFRSIELMALYLDGLIKVQIAAR